MTHFSLYLHGDLYLYLISSKHVSGEYFSIKYNLSITSCYVLLVANELPKIQGIASLMIFHKEETYKTSWVASIWLNLGCGSSFRTLCLNGQNEIRSNSLSCSALLTWTQKAPGPKRKSAWHLEKSGLLQCCINTWTTACPLTLTA